MIYKIAIIILAYIITALLARKMFKVMIIEDDLSSLAFVLFINVAMVIMLVKEWLLVQIMFFKPINFINKIANKFFGK